jgi:MoaA/NifB/PqqE/SkfB family radical SAM enzyme
LKKINTDTFCYLPFGSIYVEPTGELTPCCIAKPFKENINWKDFSSIDDLINSKPYRRIRKELLQGIEPSECDACFVNKNVHREACNEEFEKESLKDDLYNEDYTVNKVTYVDLRLSNLCNFACRMCFHGLSSSWYEYWEYISGIKGYTDKNEKFVVADKNGIKKFSEKNIDTISKIYLAGGEPFINPQTFELLDRFTDSQASKITVLINTNLSTLKYKGVDILDKLTRFKFVYFACSCDGINEVGEFQRPGFKTGKFLKNLKELVRRSKAHLNFRVEIDYTVSTINVYHTKEFIDFIHNNYLNRDNIRLHSVVLPWYFAVGFLENNIKNEIISLYEGYLKEYNDSDSLKESIKVFIKGMKDSFSPVVQNKYQEEFKFMRHPVEETFRRFDEIHNTDYKKTAPLLEEVVKQYYKRKKTISELNEKVVRLI